MPRTRSIALSQLKLGIVGLVALGLAILMILAVGGQGGFFWQRYPLKTRFEAVQGLKSGAVVRLNGKEVGRVTSVDFAGAQIDVAMQVNKAVRPLVTTRSTATLGSLSLLGEPIVDISAAPDAPPIPDWGYVPSSAPSAGFSGLSTKASAGIDKLSDILSDIQEGRGTLGKLVTDEAVYDDLRNLTTSAAAVARAIEQGKGTLGALAKDPASYESLKTSLANLQTLTDRINSGQGTLGKLLNDPTIADSLAKTSSHFADISARLDAGEGTAGKLLHDDRMYNQLNDVTARMDRLVTQLEGGQGTAGQLLHDKALYDNANSAVAELRNLISDIRKDPRKYLNVKVSIF